MVCHIDKQGGLVVLIPVCVRCKRELKRDVFKGISNEDSLTMASAPVAMRDIRFVCPKNHAVYVVGALDLAEMTKYPTDKIKFESTTNTSNIPVLR